MEAASASVEAASAASVESAAAAAKAAAGRGYIWCQHGDRGNCE